MTRAKSDNQNIFVTPDLDILPDPRGIGSVAYESMCRYKNEIAQIDGMTEQRETYGQVLKRSVRVAIEMKARGVTPNDVISICSHNNLNSCVPFFATQFLGAQIASFDPTLSVTETVHLLKQVAPKMIFVNERSLPLFEESIKEIDLKAEIVVFGVTRKHSSFSDFLKESAEECTFKPVELDDAKKTAMIFFSSGTTGLAKGICVSHYGFLYQTNNMIAGGWNYDVVLLFATLYWISSSIYLLTTTLLGKTRIILENIETDLIWKMLSKYKVTFSFSSPSLAISLLKSGRPEEADVNSLSDLLIGGGAILKEQLSSLQTLFPKTKIYNVYGQTELSGCISYFKPAVPKHMELLRKYPVSCGVPMNGMCYKVVNPETEESLGPNQEGELRIKSTMVMNGYYKLNSDDAWDSEGWLKTGDIVYYNEDNCLFVLDRIKDMMKFRSWHVLPAALENVLLTHPAVKSAAVVGVPHEEDGEHPLGLVVLHHSSANTSPEELVKYVEERVSDRQRLRAGIRIVDNIPVTPSNKVKRREIKNKIIKGEL